MSQIFAKPSSDAEAIPRVYAGAHLELEGEVLNWTADVLGGVLGVSGLGGCHDGLASNKPSPAHNCDF